jgi:hypothetical protein
MALIGDETVHVFLAQHRRVMGAVRGVDLQERAQLGARLADAVQRGR